MNPEDKTPDDLYPERPDAILHQPAAQQAIDSEGTTQFDPFRTPGPAEMPAHTDHTFPIVSPPPLRQVIGNVVDSWYACLLVPVLGVIAGLFVSVAFVILAIVVYQASGGQIPRNPNDLMLKLAAEPAFLVLLLVPNQLVFLFTAIGIARFSNHSLADRLGLGMGRASLLTWPVYVLATPLVGLVISSLLSIVVEQESSNMKFVEDLVKAQGGLRFLLVLMLIAAVPGICEEVLFRGFSQTFLSKSWPLPLAICASAALFAMAHIEPIHAIAVFPLGIWFGVITWRTKSIIPAVICHFCNNFLSVISVQYDLEEAWGAGPIWQFGAVSGVFFLIALWLLIKRDKAGIG